MSDICLHLFESGAAAAIRSRVATELDDAMTRLDAAADALAQTPLGRMDTQALARWNVAFPAPSEALAVSPSLSGRRVAVARDAAFCFLYQANLDTLRQLGAEVVFFSALSGDPLPACEAWRATVPA